MGITECRRAQRSVAPGLYASEGDYVQAALSLSGAIPGGELVAGGSRLLRLGHEADEALSGASKIEHLVELGADADKAAAVSGDAAKAEDLEKLACNLSFSPDTSVATESGQKPIAALAVGERVLAYDPATGQTDAHRVDAVMTHTDRATETLRLDSGTIETTPNHPVFSADRGWVSAAELKAGEHIRTASGIDAVVIDFTIHHTPATMWDLTVDGAHSFFVGPGRVLVHNCGGLAPISMDQAVELGASHVNPDGLVEVTRGGNYQFRSIGTLPDGTVETRMARFDVNPSSAHVQAAGPHLNLETHWNGVPVGNRHIPIDPLTVRPGDIP